MKPGDLIKAKKGPLALYDTKFALRQLCCVEHREICVLLLTEYGDFGDQMIKVLRPNGTMGWVPSEGMEPM